MNGSHTFPVASWTYQHTSVGGGYGGQCYAISSFTWGPQPQGNVDSGPSPSPRTLSLPFRASCLC